MFRQFHYDCCCAFLICLGAASSARGSLTLVGGSGLPQAGNLVANGSFENGHPLGTGNANIHHWATGTTLTPFALPPGWSSSGTTQTYARWGSDDNGPTYELAAGDTLPLTAGQLAMYFGNGLSFLNQAPTFNPNGSVTFVNPPTFSPIFGGPAVLSQTVNTQLSPAPSYTLTFWVTGEDAGGNPFTNEGIFGFRMTNVLAGDPMQFLAVPAGAGPQGASRYYRYDFVPINALLPVMIEFTNWGHLDLAPFGMSMFTTEVVLDDVVIQRNLFSSVAIPEPATLTLLWPAMAAALATRKRRRRRALRCE